MSDFSFRGARPDDLDRIYLLGFDVWGDGAALDAYLEECRRSPKYARGTWRVLADERDVPVAALITYPLAPRTIGIGSVATAPAHRRQGLASRLVRETLAATQPLDAAFLHSDIGPELYARLGFVALPAEHQRKPGSLCMAWANDVAALCAAPGFRAPDYF